MNRRTFLGVAAMILGLVGPVSAGNPYGDYSFRPHGDDRHCCHANPSWHNAYYNTSWGAPVALVVPPTAEVQSHYSWGVGNTWVTPNCPQFGRNWPGPGYYDGRAFRPTPPWPSSTDQFGVNYVRGPWR